MKFKIRKFVLFCFVYFSSINSFSQNYFGFNVGFNEGSLFTYRKQKDYIDSYHFKSGLSLSFFYETKLASTTNYRLELQYIHQKTDFEVYYISSKFGFYKNLDLVFDRFNFNLIYVFQLINKDSYKINLLTGPNISYTFQAKSYGYGWDTDVSQVDTSNSQVFSYKKIEWEKSKSKSNEISDIFLGVDLGFEILIPINKTVDIHIINKYNLSISSPISFVDIRYTPFFCGYLNVGVRLKL
jgi:hypothetical protein